MNTITFNTPTKPNNLVFKGDLYLSTTVPTEGVGLKMWREFKASSETPVILTELMSAIESGNAVECINTHLNNISAQVSPEFFTDFPIEKEWNSGSVGEALIAVMAALGMLLCKTHDDLRIRGLLDYELDEYSSEIFKSDGGDITTLPFIDVALYNANHAATWAELDQRLQAQSW